MLPWEIAERIRDRCLVGQLGYIVAGHDVWADVRARGESGPTIAEHLAEYGIYLSEANIDRRQGLNTLRQYLAWRGQGPNGSDGLPRLRFMRTAGNLWLFDQLETMVCDPGDPEDVLKQNANPDTGEGGDDGYDCLRYAVSSRPLRGGPAPVREDVPAYLRNWPKSKRDLGDDKGPVPETSDWLI